MAAIGYVTKLEDGRYQGNLKTFTIRAEVTFTPNPDKSNGNQPDYRIFSDGIEIGAAWIRTAETSGKEYVSVSIAAPSSARTSSTPISARPPVRTMTTSSP
ncbi:DUF736 domain-containing protein [Salaquimonas pukyongi]|uniref:DUF736 domain-containing protein n=1 Tax=Salaquimonas pukyongi TaxID=2712698 RepID=UPI001FCD0B4D|nr:DUF736 domain-containing protein [Salaquimonas pukyongi]